MVGYLKPLFAISIPLTDPKQFGDLSEVVSEIGDQMLTKSRKLPQGLAIASQSVEFWRRLAPDLTISDRLTQNLIVRPQKQEASDRIRLINEGYLHIRQPGFDAPLDRIQDAMARIVDAGMPAAFVGVYDEVWSIAAQMQALIGGLLGAECALNPDFWAGYADQGDNGQTARRKRPGSSLNRDRSPNSLSVWVPVTDATPDNGCPYLVPANQDRNYAKPDPERADSRLQSIKAIPAGAGDMIVTSGETYHWRGRTSRYNTDGPLMSLSWEFQSKALAPFDGHLVDSYPLVPFETRLGLLARQMPRNKTAMSNNPVWRAVQQTLANRFPVGQQPQP